MYEMLKQISKWCFDTVNVFCSPESLSDSVRNTLHRLTNSSSADSIVCWFRKNWNIFWSEKITFHDRKILYSPNANMGRPQKFLESLEFSTFLDDTYSGSLLKYMADVEDINKYILNLGSSEIDYVRWRLETGSLGLL